MKLSGMRRRLQSRYAVGGAVAVMLIAWPAAGQVGGEEKAAIAVAGSALAAITQGDMTALTDLMLPEAVMFPTSTRDGVTRYWVRTRAEQRAAPVTRKITERGFRPEARVNGPVAIVWYPYDLYVDGQWSHCGVDVFTLIRTDGRWRLATMSWSAEQPPACEKHPDGPPKP
jgi:SnoaL-like protein